MATPYSDCYDVFLSHINDAEILYPYDEETEELYQNRIHSVCLTMFKRAVVKFFFSQTSLKKDNNTETFENDLRDIEVEIIGMFMLREYYRKQLNFLASLKQSFSDKDWKAHDPSGQMNQYRQMLKETDTEINELIIKNSYTDEAGSLKGWWE